jgi:prevent-host-death family protein
MQSIGVRELRQNASAVLRRVERGATIEVTDRGRPVALLTPVKTRSALEQLRAAGEIEPARGDLRDLSPPLKLPKGSASPSVTLAALRAHER